MTLYQFWHGIFAVVGLLAALGIAKIIWSLAKFCIIELHQFNCLEALEVDTLELMRADDKRKADELIAKSYLYQEHVLKQILDRWIRQQIEVKPHDASVLELALEILWNGRTTLVPNSFLPDSVQLVERSARCHPMVSSITLQDVPNDILRRIKKIYEAAVIVNPVWEYKLRSA